MMKKRWMAGILALVMLFPVTAAAQVQEVSQEDEALQQLYDDERYAKAMYEGLDAAFSQAVYAQLIRAEENHIRAVARVAERAGIALAENPVPVDIPATPEEGVQMAIDYERYDIRALEELLERFEGTRLERMLTNLLEGSRRHEQHLLRFQTAMQEGTTDDWLPEDCRFNRTDRPRGRNQDTVRPGRQTRPDRRSQRDPLCPYFDENTDEPAGNSGTRGPGRQNSRGAGRNAGSGRRSHCQLRP